MIKIAVFIPRYAPVFGGAENQARLLNQELTSTGEVHIPFIVTKRMLKGLPSFERIDDIPVHRLGIVGFGILGELIFYCNAIWFFFRNRKQFDLIHSHSSSVPGYFATIGGFLLNKPVILKLSANGELMSKPKNKFKAWLKKYMVRFMARNSHFVALNKEGMSELTHLKIKQKYLIPNGINLSKSVNLKHIKTRKELGLSEDAFIIMFSGRFVKLKGIDTLLEAFKKFISAEYVSEAILFLMGSSDNQADTQLFEDESLQRHIVRYKAAPDEVGACLALGNVFVFPSRREGMPNAVIEAIAMGLPIILSNIEPHKEIIYKCKNVEDVSFYAVDDYKALADCLTIYYQNFLSGKNKQQAILPEEFDIAHVARTYIQLYRKILRTEC